MPMKFSIGITDVRRFLNGNLVHDAPAIHDDIVRTLRGGFAATVISAPDRGDPQATRISSKPCFLDSSSSVRIGSLP